MRQDLHFETLLSDLSATFINVSASQVDSQIESALRTIVESLGIDRAGFGEMCGDQLVVTHSWELPGVPPSPKLIVDDQLPWYASQVRAGNPIRLRSLPEDFPAEATAERAYCMQFGLKSHLQIPLKMMGAVVGGIGLSSFQSPCDWPDALIQRLRLVGDVFTNALARKRADDALRVAEEQARKFRDELAHATRLELASQLTTSIAHEVNQPLCAIASNAQTALELLDRGDTEEVMETLRDICSDARRGSEVIGCIRNMVKKAEPCRTPTRLALIIDEVAPLLRREAASKSVSLRIDVDGKNASVACDKVQLQQIVFNLVLNAIEAVAGGSVGPPEVVLRASAAPPDHANVSVEDSGVGLCAEDCERIFAPFFTTKSNGLGMGLAISRSIIVAHGGKIWATPGNPHGTVVQFQVPATYRNDV